MFILSHIDVFMKKFKLKVISAASVHHKQSCCSPCEGIALFPGKARLLDCKHYLQSYIPPLVNPGQPQKIDCQIEEVMYVGPFSNKTKVNHWCQSSGHVQDSVVEEREKRRLHLLLLPLSALRPGLFCLSEEVYSSSFFEELSLQPLWQKALVVRGPTDVRRKELVFMQFSCNETGLDFSAITYLIFARFSDLINRWGNDPHLSACPRPLKGNWLNYHWCKLRHCKQLVLCVVLCLCSTNQTRFMRESEKNCSIWTFSGGFRTWVKMSLVRTSGRDNDAVEFRQEVR